MGSKGGKHQAKHRDLRLDDHTLYIYEDLGQACADHFAHESFLVRTEADGIEMILEQLRSKTSDATMFDAGGYMQYFSDSALVRNQSHCQKAKVALYQPHLHQGKFMLKTIKGPDSKGALILSSDFINISMHA